MNKKHHLAIVMSTVLFFLCTSLLATIKPIKFATSPPYPPFIKVKTSNEYYGIDVDIAKKLCQKLNTSYTFSNDKLINMIPTLENGKYDIWFGGITITDERKKEIAFSEPYFSSTLQLITTDPSIQAANPTDLKNKSIGIIAGSADGQLVSNIYGNTAKIIAFRKATETLPISLPAALTALKNGQVDAVIDDELVLKIWLAKQPDNAKYHLINLPHQDQKLIKQKYAFAVAKNNVKLLKEINNLLSEIKANGTLDTIIKTHFSNP